MHRQRPSIAWLLLGVGLACAPEPLQRGSFPDWNLLLVTIDTLRWDRVGAYGSGRGLTPNLDRLASEGIRFETIYTSAPLTLPAHTSLLTGTSPPLHGVRDNGTFRFAGEMPTLADLLQDQGYATGAFVGAFVLDARFGLDRGFDEYDDRYGERRGQDGVEVAERNAEAVMKPAVRWIGKRGNDERWFAWVHFYDPHAPYDAPARYLDDREPYDAEVAYSDSILGLLLKHLNENEKLSRTLVVVTSDHGESLGDHGERSHGAFAYQPTLRVPLVFWASERLAPKLVEIPARLIDLAPTLLELLGLPVPDAMEGRSLIDAVNGTTNDAPPAYFEAMNAHLARNWAPLTGVVSEGYKFIDLPIPEVYDIEGDPEEKKNLYGQDLDKARSLTEQLERIRAAHASADVTEVRRSLTSTERGMLETLGYVGAGSEPYELEYSTEDDPKTLIEAANRLEDAQEMFHRGETGRSLAMARGILDEHPSYSSAYVVLAAMLRGRGERDEALELLQTAVATNERDPSLAVTLAVYLQEAGKLREAASVLDKVIASHPDYLDARSVLGTTYILMGRNAAAGEAFMQVLELDPTAANAYENLGIVAIRDGRPTEAITRLERAIELDPRLASAYKSLGLARARAGESAPAVKAWKRSLELDPNQVDVLFNLGMHLVTSGRPEEARPYLSQFISEAPREGYAAQVQRARELLRR